MARTLKYYATQPVKNIVYCFEHAYTISEPLFYATGEGVDNVLQHTPTQQTTQGIGKPPTQTSFPLIPRDSRGLRYEFQVIAMVR